MKKNLVVIVSLIILSLSAEIRENIDTNTLWIEDGVNIQTAAENKKGAWNNSTAKITTLESGGFSIAPLAKGKYSIGQYLPRDSQYPYLVFEIKGVQDTGGYKNITMYTASKKHRSMVGNLQKGIFVFPFEEFIHKSSYLRMDVFGVAVDFKYIKNVKVPDQYIEVNSEKEELSVNDKVEFKVFLKDEAEDVTIRFYDSYLMAQLVINDMDKLQLKPKDKNTKIWSTEIDFTSLTRGANPIKGDILMRITVLGGNVDVPIWQPLSKRIQK